MKKIITGIIDLFFENSCLICNTASSNNILCKSCKEAIEQIPNKGKRSFKEIYVYSYGFYDGKLREAILALKSGKKKLANYFSQKLITFWKEQSVTYKNLMVVPIPSHKNRIKERGYCQSTLIARDFAFSIGQEFSSDFLVRIKETSFMNSLSNAQERIENIKDAFKVNDLKSPKENILIIDDILTSGSTMRESARTIHKKYPKLNLIGLTIATGDTYT